MEMDTWTITDTKSPQARVYRMMCTTDRPSRRYQDRNRPTAISHPITMKDSTTARIRVEKQFKTKSQAPDECTKHDPENFHQIEIHTTA